jgi:hypothetical protein
MYLGLLGLGVLVTAAGASMIGFGIPINAFSFGNTLIVGGTTALVGGLILIAIAAAVRQLRRIADALGHPAGAPIARPAESAAEAVPAPAPAATAAAQAAAPSAGSPRIPYPPKPRPAAPRAPVPSTAELMPKPGAGPARDPRFEPRPAGGPPGLDLPPKPAFEGPGRDFRVEPRVAASRELKPPESTSPELRPEPRVAAPPIDGSDELMPRDRRPAAEGPRRPGEPPPVAPESEELSLSPRPSPPPPPRPALSLPASIAEVFGSKSWSESPPETTVAAEPPGAPRPDARHDARPASAPQPPPGSFDALWPADPVPGKPRTEGPQQGARSEAPRVDEMAGQDRRGDAQPSAILKSGVIDGMAYTLYTDGSITADLPQGTMRFSSVEALRAHLDKGS